MYKRQGIKSSKANLFGSTPCRTSIVAVCDDPSRMARSSRVLFVGQSLLVVCLCPGRICFVTSGCRENPARPLYSSWFRKVVFVLLYSEIRKASSLQFACASHALHLSPRLFDVTSAPNLRRRYILRDGALLNTREHFMTPVSVC